LVAARVFRHLAVFVARFAFACTRSHWPGFSGGLLEREFFRPPAFGALRRPCPPLWQDLVVGFWGFHVFVGLCGQSIKSVFFGAVPLIPRGHRGFGVFWLVLAGFWFGRRFGGGSSRFFFFCLCLARRVGFPRAKKSPGLGLACYGSGLRRRRFGPSRPAGRRANVPCLLSGAGVLRFFSASLNTICTN